MLTGDVPDAVSALKRQANNDLVIMGSAELIQTLMRHNLIDEYMLIIHPRVLGAGRRLFPDRVAPTALRLVSAAPTSTAALVAVYRPRT